MTVHIIHNKENKHRYDHLMRQLEQQGITDYILHDAVMMKNPVEGVAQAHKNIITANYNQEEIVTFEDDIVFTKPDGWQKYLEWKEELPDNWRVYLGGYYHTTKRIPATKNLELLRNAFNGMHCYTIRKPFYDTFLSCPAARHIDNFTGSTMDYIYAPKLLPTRQMAEAELGYSERTGKPANYSKKHSRLNFY